MGRISIVIPVLNEARHISLLIKRIQEVFSGIKGWDIEIICVDGGSKDETARIAKESGANVFIQENHGFGQAIYEGFRHAKGDFIVTMDADFSHPPEFIPEMLKHIRDADIIIASRYIPGGGSNVRLLRSCASKFLCWLFRVGLSMPLRDSTSGFKIYKREAVESLEIRSREFEVQPEIAIHAYAQGWKIKEIPLFYKARQIGKSHISRKLVRLAKGYLTIFWEFFKKRNSPFFADYDERAYNSNIMIQRYWQRKKYSIILDFLQRRHTKVVDLGCGSSKILQDLPDAVCVDINMGKLRYIRKSNTHLVNANVRSLPFKSEVFDCAICSEVVEHVNDETIFKEFNRILRPGGQLILATPDYAKLVWRVVEFLYYRFFPGGYKEQHIKQYTKLSLEETLRKYGFKTIAHNYIGGADLVVNAVKVKQFSCF